MEATKEEIAIKELSFAIYQQAKEIALKERRIEALTAKLRAIEELLWGDQDKNDPVSGGNNIWLENRKKM
jgi:uncharacterized coiled-coil protein SlyX